MRLVLMSLMLWSSFAWGYNFGFPGRNGVDGRDGADGRSGRDATVFASQGPVDLNLDGSNGSDGSLGDNGSDAYGCSQRMGRMNEFGARGGNAGDGGKGGDGGNGGDAIIFYTDQAPLSSVRISNSPGSGGIGARSGYEGRGCQCYRRSWSHRICRTEQRCTQRRVCDSNGQNCRTERDCRPVQVCNNEHFYCSDGQSGSRGHHGNNGSSGNYGSIKVVKDLREIPSQNPNAYLTIGQLAQAEFVLSKQIWQSKNDGQSVFAPGSRISGSYKKFVRLASHKVFLDWKEQRRIDDFKDFKIGLEFDGENIHLDMPEGLFIKYDINLSGDSTVIVVNEILTTEEVSALGISKTSGYGKNLLITIADKNELSDKVKSEVKLQFVHRKFRFWYVVYDKMVPEEFVKAYADKLEVDVGSLGIGSAYTARGKLVRYTLWIKRSFGNSFTEVKLYQSPINLK